MSNVEHLIENAIMAIETHEEWDDMYNAFVESEINQDMAKLENLPLDKIFEMGIYVVYSYTPYRYWN